MTMRIKKASSGTLEEKLAPMSQAERGKLTRDLRIAMRPFFVTMENVQSTARTFAVAHDWDRLARIKKKMESWKNSPDPSKRWFAEELLKGGERGLTAWDVQGFQLPRGDLAQGIRRRRRDKGKRVYDDTPYVEEFERRIKGITDKRCIANIRADVASRMPGRGNGGKNTDDKSKERRLRRALADRKKTRGPSDT